MPRYALINANGSINWSRDSDLAGVVRSGVGSYALRFSNDCDNDVFVFHARSSGEGCDGLLVGIGALQDGSRRICLSVGHLANFNDRHDAAISYVRYRKIDELRLGGGEEQLAVEGGYSDCQGAETQDWYAWLDLMLPGPPALHVTGEVYVANPGIDPLLTPKVPQGVNPGILLLDLHLIQRPGIWPQVFVWKPARYDRVPAGKTRYERVNIFCGDAMIADIPVNEVH